MSSTFGIGHMNFRVIFFRSLSSMTRCSLPLPLGTMMIKTDQLEWLLHITGTSRSLFISFFTQSQCFMVMGYGLCETGSESPVSICILFRCIVPILVSSCTNCNLNVSNNWLKDFLTLPRWVFKGGVKASGLTCSSIIFCVVILFTGVCGIWSMGGSIWPMHCPLLNVTCLFL